MPSQDRLPLDFAQIPMDAGVALLQRLALRLLDLLLAKETAPATLATWLSDADLRLLNGPSSGQLRRNAYAQLPSNDRWGVLRLRLGTFWRRLRGRPLRYDYSRSLGDAARGRSAPWLARIQAQIESERRLGGIGATSIPRDWWSLVGERAWRDPDFQHAVSRRVHAYLHQRMLFQRGELPAPHFAPQSFWLLIALTANGKQKGWQSWLGRGRWRAERLQLLRTLAQAEVGRLQWAGIWDQWLVIETTQRWPGCTRSLPATLHAALAALPLLAQLPEAFQFARQQDEAADLPLATVDWQKDLPSWLPAYYYSFAADELMIPITVD